jgi:hypothetical protein
LADEADEADEALRTSPMAPRQHFEFLVEKGIIDRTGRVLVAKLFGSNGAQTPTTSTNGAPADNS